MKNDSDNFPEIENFVARRIDDKNLFKEAVKEAAKEWLQEQFTSFGKWTALGMASIFFYGLIKVAVINGFWPKG